MRRISAWVAIWAVPTLLAGIYGMNFRYLPELEWRVGDPLVLATMAVICLGLYRAFRRSGWLLPRWWRGETPMGRIRGSFTMQAAPRSSMIGPMLNTDNERGGRHGNPKDW
jgi:CorA-like Mg2+ transporter protein